ncbi:hypothetical protein J6590_103388 [Homalodisca vitripennis]|nr:hypothetical protein J6590_103388 [Homalodisca vitripennis]
MAVSVHADSCGRYVHINSAFLMWAGFGADDSSLFLLDFAGHYQQSKFLLFVVNYSSYHMKLVVIATERSDLQTGASYGISRVVRAISAVHETCA